MARRRCPAPVPSAGPRCSRSAASHSSSSTLDPRRSNRRGSWFPGWKCLAARIRRPFSDRPERRPRGFALSSRPVIAVDLGGTRIRAAVVLPDGTRLARIDRGTPTALGPAAIVEHCRIAARAARDGVRREVAEQIAGIGVSSPGPVDPGTGVVVEPPNLGPEFRNIPLAPALGDELGLPAFLDRDTNVAALGEHAFGAAQGEDDFIYLTVSTGVGGSIVTAGKLLHGPDGLAGELGHVPVALEGPRCGCGGIGHVEAFASGAGLAKLARALVESRESPFLADRAREVGAEALSAVDVS